MEGNCDNPCYRGYGLDQNGDSEGDEKRAAFGSLRYAFGGDHPSQTTHHAVSPVPRVRSQTREGSYFNDGSSIPGETES